MINVCGSARRHRSGELNNSSVGPHPVRQLECGNRSRHRLVE
jgi:hypothetical protein